MQASRQLMVNSDANPGLGKVALLRGVEYAIISAIISDSDNRPHAHHPPAIRQGCVRLPTRRSGPDSVSGVLETCQSI